MPKLNPNQRPIIVFSDGACSGNPGPGGWGAIIIDSSEKVCELGGGEGSTTNNRMEMSGIKGALEFLAKTPGPVEIYTDSTYVIRGITQWVWGWKKNNWKTADGKEVSNKDLWEDLFALVKARGKGTISWRYVRGHVGTPGNERCDEIAVAWSRGSSVRLYRGTLVDYGLDVLKLPTQEALPEMKSKSGPKVAAHSYLSNIGGIVYRHRDWSSCERRVKGKSGAKFKKAQSKDEEKKILVDWGLSSAVEIKEG